MKRIILAVFCMSLLSVPATAGSGIITVQSSYSVQTTLDRLTKILESKGLTIFGNPKLGTPLMKSNRKIGLDLPQKALAWQDDDGKVWVSYNDPAYLKNRHGISDRDPVFMKITGALKKLIGKAVSK